MVAAYVTSMKYLPPIFIMFVFVVAVGCSDDGVYDPPPDEPVEQFVLCAQKDGDCDAGTDGSGTPALDASKGN